MPLPLHHPNHLHPRRVPSAFELRAQECIHDIERKAFAHHARAEREHVGVVVLADHAGGVCVGADAAADALHLVRRHHDALACAAQDDAEPAIAGGDAPRRRFALRGIMRARRRRGADVHRLPTARRDMRGDGLPKRDGGVIAGEDDAVVACHEEIAPLPASNLAARSSRINAPASPHRA